MAVENEETVKTCEKTTLILSLLFLILSLAQIFIAQIFYFFHLRKKLDY